MNQKSLKDSSRFSESLWPLSPPVDSLRTTAEWVRQHAHVLALGAVLGLSAFLRLWAAPLSSGPDVAQFWAFVRVFQLHGLDFYRYADAGTGNFPFEHWGFVYPPIWLLILRLALFFSPASQASDVMVDAGWRVAMKTPIIAADLAIGLLLYWAIPGSKTRKLIFASLWLLNPVAWYESAVFGQFDAIAAALLLASVIMLERGSDRLAFLLAGLALMTKQHTFIPIAFMILIAARYMNKRRLLTNCSIISGIVILLSVPFLITGNWWPYARSLFLPGIAPDYQTPLCYAFSGSGALLTYLHDIFGWATNHILQYNIPVMIVALIAAAVLVYKRTLSPLQGALVGFLLFISLNYRVNYQYLIIYIPLAILLASRTQNRTERVLLLVLTLLPAAWIWLFDMSFWFNYLKPVNSWVTPILARLGLTHNGMPDYVYVSLAVLLMVFSLAYVVYTLKLKKTLIHQSKAIALGTKGMVYENNTNVSTN